MRRVICLLFVVVLAVAACGDADDSDADDTDDTAVDGATDDSGDQAVDDGGTDAPPPEPPTEAPAPTAGSDDSATDDSATDDTATDDSATDDSATDDTATDDTTTDESATETGTESDSGFPTWAWIILGIAAIIIVAAIVRSARPGAVPTDQAWRRRGLNIGREGQVIVDLAALPPSAPVGSLLTMNDLISLESRLDQLGGQLPSLNAVAPTETSRQLVLELGESARSLRAAFEVERALQMGPQSPTFEQMRDAATQLALRRADFETRLQELTWAVEPLE